LSVLSLVGWRLICLLRSLARSPFLGDDKHDSEAESCRTFA
jgi:hypothetical protein